MSLLRDQILGLDTSNYTTSIAIVDRGGRIMKDARIRLDVPEGGRGLQQSQALFQHMANLPILLEAYVKGDPGIAAVACSDRPRPVEGSYMPVFRAGISFGRALAAAWDVPFLSFSHQEGHLAAARIGTELRETERHLAFHLSGGTSELLVVDAEGVRRIGGTRDLSFGQVIDRIGVRMGLAFPSGEAMDRLACEREAEATQGCFSPVPADANGVNLSGLEAQAAKLWDSRTMDQAAIAHEMMETIAIAVHRWGTAAVAATGCSRILFSGGVAESSYLRHRLSRRFLTDGCAVYFARTGLSADNAVGIARLGGARIWL